MTMTNSSIDIRLDEREDIIRKNSMIDIDRIERKVPGTDNHLTLLDFPPVSFMFI